MIGKKLGKLFTAIILALAAGLIGSLATFGSVNGWYGTLVKPSFNPPNWIFGPVWTTLYILMGIALYLVWDRGLKKKKVQVAFWLFIIHLFVNAGWSIVFFGLHSLFGGFVVLCILWTFIVALIWKFYEINKWAAYLLVPYILWVSFAGILNTALWLLNR